MSESTKTNTIVMETSTYLSCLVLISLLLYAAVKVHRGSKVAFLNFLIALLIVSNSTYIVYMTLYNKRQSLVDLVISGESTSIQQLTILVTVMMILDFFHYLGLNCAIWCYCFKYWIVSVEVQSSLNSFANQSPLSLRSNRQIEQ